MNAGHPVELMMAITIASTALLGLGGVVIGQIRGSLGVDAAIKRRWIVALIVSFVMGIMVVILAVNWFSQPNDLRRLVTVVAFLVQIVSFVLVALVFWLRIVFGKAKVADFSIKKDK